MENFCGSKFWDTNVTWNTEVPDFTNCFQETALVWAPCAFLWIFSPIEVYFQAHSSKKYNSWNLLTILKLIIGVCLTGLSMADMLRDVIMYLDDADVYPAEYYSSFIKTLSYIFCIILIYTGRRRGIRTSGVLFMFFLLITIAEIIQYRSIFIGMYFDQIPLAALKDDFSFIITTITMPLVFGELILFSFADHKETLSESGVNIEKISPEETSSFLSHLSFWWFNDLALLGYKKPLNMDDMWRLSEWNTSKFIVSKFDKYYLPMMEKAMKLRAQEESVLGADATNEKGKEERKPVAGVLTPIIKAYGLQFLAAALYKLVSSVLTFASPLILDMLIAYISGSEPYWRGFFYAAILFFAAMLESVLNSQHEYLMYSLSMRVKSALISAIYRKALVLSSSARHNYTVGEIVNLMSVDIQRMMDYFSIVNILWSAPLQIAIALALLWQQIGISTLAGLGLMIVLIPINGFITVKLKTLQVHVMRAKDKRTKLMNEILSGIKVLKLYGWEESFEKKAMKCREDEVASLTTQAYYSAVITFVFTTAPFFVGLASFAMFVLISPDNILDANRAFVSLSLFNILKLPFAFLPMVITFTAMFHVSLTRLNKFLSCEELDANAITYDKSGGSEISVDQATFSWSPTEEPLLKDITVNIEKGSLVAVVGSVGSGKSSLLSAILGDMIKKTGRVNIQGSVAYVPQQAWIQNATLQKNIVFLNNMRSSWYDKVTEMCCLKPDFDILPGGDMTEIGEKGINLSGGQKQRVSLARAVYSKSDIYLLDDPLSAVDAHVSKDIFDNIIGHNGLLKGKTRILVTHRITVLPDCDSIIVIKDGKISEEGSYNELLTRKGAFSEFLIQHLTQATDAVDSVTANELQVMEQIAAHVGSPEILRQISQLSGAESDNVFSDGGRNSTRRRLSSQLSVRGDRLRSSSLLASQKKSISKEEVKKTKDQTKLIDAETSEIGSVKLDIYMKYFKACGWRSTIWVILSFAASHALNVGSSIWLSEWSNDSLNPTTYNDTNLRDLRLGVYGGLGGAEAIFIMIASLILSICTLTGSKILHDESLSHILKAPMSFFDTTPMGRILNRFTKDIDAIDNVIRFNFRMLLLCIFRTIVNFVLISLQTWYFLFVILPLGVLYYLVQVFYIASSRQLKRLESVSRSPIYTHFSETVSGSTSIRAFGATNAFIQESNDRVDFNHTSYFPSVTANRWLAIRLEFLGYSISFLAALLAVLTRESLSPGIAGLAISSALTMTATLNMLVRASADIETNIVSVERCLEYTTTPIEAPRRIESSQPSNSWPDDGNISFENYSVRYREGLELILKSVNCDIKAKEKVGIVGRTGAGKSSLTLCLFRLIESVTGRITIDGVDIAKLGLYDLRSKLTIIPQDPVLFTGTLRMNLDPFENHTDDELWAALEHAHLKSFVTSTEKGLDHMISEGGENLSVGQRQLLCLARALLRKTKVLIMDEATAAVDMETDELIQTTIRKEFAECTVLTIAHRLNTIMDYDRVIVLDKGEIAEFDSPGNLLKNTSSIFYGMAKDADLVT